MTSTLRYAVYQYGHDRELQRVGVWEKQPPQGSGYWVIYIHGGAWRDPRITHESFQPTIDKLLSLAGDSPTSSIAAFASIDYRLSPHPQFPQDPATTPRQEYRDASHPEHIADVWSALRFLQDNFGFGSRYLLLGHSAGATLALQLLMGPAALEGGSIPRGVALPSAVIGLEGIYDLQGLVDRQGPEYAKLFEGAFGASSNWSRASPMKFGEGFGSGWKKGNLVLLGWGPADELIDEPEIDGMARVLKKDDVETLVVKNLEGTHDGMWEDGTPFAMMILKTLAELTK